MTHINKKNIEIFQTYITVLLIISESGIDLDDGVEHYCYDLLTNATDYFTNDYIKYENLLSLELLSVIYMSTQSILATMLGYNKTYLSPFIDLYPNHENEPLQINNINNIVYDRCIQHDISLSYMNAAVSNALTIMRSSINDVEKEVKAYISIYKPRLN